MNNPVLDYEFFLIISAKLNDQEIENIIEKFKNLIEADGVLKNIEKWGKRKLAYSISHEIDGFYVLFNFSGNSSLPAELNRICNITDGILRNLLVKKENTKIVNKQKTRKPVGTA